MKKRNSLLESALWYRNNGFSVIPAKRDKKPRIAWQRFQDEIPTADQVQDWWSKWPDANVAIITGSISNLIVLDADSEDGRAALEDFLPDSAMLPTVKTPKGWHFYFHHIPGISNGVRIISDCDVRSDGGYVIAPPSCNGGKNIYQWLEGLKISDVSPIALPGMLIDILKQGAGQASPSERIKKDSIPLGGGSGGGVYRERNIRPKKSATKAQQSVTKRNISFEKGNRDESLFHLANHLVKSGMDTVTIQKYLVFFAKNCSPPFPEKEISQKITSALKRHPDKKINITQQIREWIAQQKGNFSATFHNNAQHFVTSEQKAKARVVLGRLVKEGLLERDDQRAGHYRIVSSDCEQMDFCNAVDEVVSIWMPFGMDRLVYIMPGNIILLAGDSNAGKTALLLNIIKNNMGRFSVHYFNSEMGAGELRKRLCGFDNIKLEEWAFDAYERNSDFADVIKPGKGNINIIDFLEIHDNFYEIGGRLAEIHGKLNGAVAIIALQKNKGVETGLGGGRSLEKPRLYLSMSHECLKIVKGKNWAGSENPNGLQLNFKIINGCVFHQNSKWHREEVG